MAGTIVVDRIESDASYASTINVASQITFSNTVNLTVASTFPAGTVGAPSITTSGDTNTGLYFPAADTIAFAEGGAEAMRIDSSGNVGIGTSSPTALLDVNGNVAITGSARRITGDFSNATTTSRVSFQSSTTNGATVVQLIPNGTSSSTQFAAYGGSDILNTSVGQLTNNGTEVRVASGIFGTGTFLPMTFYTSGSERMRIDSSGNLLVGTTSANGTEKFNVTSSSTEVAFFTNSSNTNAYSGIRSNIGSGGNNTTTWHFRGETRGVNNWYLYGNGTTSYSSDIRLKKNVQTARGYLEDLNKLRVVKYQWIGDNPDCQQVELGLIAQEVEEVFPNLIQEHEIEGVGDIKNIKQSVLPFMMLKAIQELKAINDTQTETINALTARIDAQSADIAELKTKVA